MRSGQARLVTLCQQLLTLGVVAAVLTPAATVLPLEVVAPGAAPAPGAVPPGLGAAEAAAEVETEPVEPDVTEQQLTPEPGAGAARPGRDDALPSLQTTSRGDERVVGEAEAADGFRTVGVTWDGSEQVDEDELTVEVRSREGAGDWSGWTELEYHDDHAPEPGSREARRTRPGTEPLVLGEVGDVQVRATGDDVPADLTVALVEPGESAGTELAEPAIDTGSAGADEPAGQPVVAATSARGTGDAALSAGTSAPKPKIFSRAQWGADERLRDPRSLRYGKVSAGFVHHTVNGNSYTKAQVPGILRSIYAYHTRSRGWSDVGYNFLVDKYGRIWEGRHGGVDRPVVGAHTLGYNGSSFAMSAIGNFETARPSDAMLGAYGRLMAWKLGLHGIRAGSANQVVAGKRLRAINGHRDAGSTACPGRYLYARLGTIRTMAAARQQQEQEPEQEVTVGDRETDLVATKHPDIVLRRDSDKQVFLLPTGGLTRLAKPRTAAEGWAGRKPVASPDLDGDGKGDVIATGNGRGVLWSGRGDGTFSRTHAVKVLRDKDLVAAVGDLDEDGDNDLVGRRPDGSAVAFLGNGRGRFVARSLGRSWSAAGLASGAGDLTGDGHVDVVVRETGGVLRLLRGDGAGGFSGSSRVSGAWDRYNRITGLGDWNRDGHADLFARGRGGAGWVLPGRGDGTFTRRFGPVWRVHGLAGLSGGGSVVGNAAPDLVGVTRGRLEVLRNTGRFDASAPHPTGLVMPGVNALLNVGDWDRDGDGDVVSRHRNGVLRLHRGDGNGNFAPQRRLGTGFGDVRRLASVGDVTGDGRPDIVGQPEGGRMRIYPGRGLDGVGAGYEARVRSPRTLNLKPYDWVISLGKAKSPPAARERTTGLLWLLRTSSKGVTKRRFLAEDLDAYDMYGR